MYDNLFNDYNRLRIKEKPVAAVKTVETNVDCGRTYSVDRFGFGFFT